MMPWMTIYGNSNRSKTNFGRILVNVSSLKKCLKTYCRNIVVYGFSYTIPCTFMILTGTIKLYGLGYGCQNFFFEILIFLK